MNKNNPIAVRNLIKELIESSKQFAVEIQNDDLTLFLQANGVYSEFYFKINKHQFSTTFNELMYNIEFAPQSIHNENPLKYQQDYGGVKECLRIWISVISQYPNIEKTENTKTIHESAILKEPNTIKEVKQTPKEKALNWSMIPEWAKILGGLGAIASLAKVIIELNK